MSENKNLNCSSIRMLLSSYIDNELSESENFAVTEHISHCESCKKVLADMYKVRDMVKSVYAPKGDVDFSAKIMANIKHRKQYGSQENVEKVTTLKSRTSKRKIKGSLFSKLVFTTVAAATILFAVGGTVVYFEKSAVNRNIPESYITAQIQNKQDKIDNK